MTFSGLLPLPSARPSFQNGFARNKSESAFPELWNALIGAWCPSIGFQGRRLQDFSGRGNHGAFSTGMTNSAWIDSPWGPALVYDGTDDCINIGTGIVSLSTPFTLSMRYTVDDTTHNTYSLIGSSVGGDATKSYFIFIHRTDKNGMVLQYDLGPGAALFSASPSIATVANKWHHVTMYRNPSIGSFASLMDGNQSIGDATNPSFSHPIDGTWGIGSWDPINVTNLWKGKIGDVFLWNRGLLQREMASLFEGAHPLRLSQEWNSDYTAPISPPATGSPGSMMLTGVGT